jgi:uncharacterized protein (DUF362 family)
VYDVGSIPQLFLSEIFCRFRDKNSPRRGATVHQTVLMAEQRASSKDVVLAMMHALTYVPETSIKKFNERHPDIKVIWHWSKDYYQMRVH